MEAEGLDPWFPMEKLAVRGYVEVLRHFLEIHAIRRKLRRRLVAARPRLFIGVDAPDFNLPLERKLKRAGIPAVHYVSRRCGPGAAGACPRSRRRSTRCW